MVEHKRKYSSPILVLPGYEPQGQILDLAVLYDMSSQMLEVVCIRQSRPNDEHCSLIYRHPKADLPS